MQIETMIQNLRNGKIDNIQLEVDNLMLSPDEEAVFSFAEELLALGFLDEGKQLFQELLRRYPNEGEVVFYLAEIEIEKGNEEEALLLLETIDHEDPIYLSSLILQADCYEEMGLPEVSVAKLEYANKLFPCEIVLEFALAETYAAHGKYSQALPLYLKIVQIKQVMNGISVLAQIAKTLMGLGKFEESMNYFSQVEKNLHDLDYYFNYGLAAYSAEQYDIAKKQFLQLYELNPEYHGLYLNLAKIYDRLNDQEKAIEFAKLGIAENPYDTNLLFFAAQQLFKTGKTDEATKILTETIAIDPSYLEATLLLAEIYLQNGHYRDTIDLVSTVSEVGEIDPKLNWMQASAYCAVQDYPNAKKQFALACPDLIDNQIFLDEYGSFLLETGEITQAKMIYEKLTGLDPTNTEYIDILDRL